MPLLSPHTSGPTTASWHLERKKSGAKIYEEQLHSITSTEISSRCRDFGGKKGKCCLMLLSNHAAF